VLRSYVGVLFVLNVLRSAQTVRLCPCGPCPLCPRSKIVSAGHSLDEGTYRGRMFWRIVLTFHCHSVDRRLRRCFSLSRREFQQLLGIIAVYADAHLASMVYHDAHPVGERLVCSMLTADLTFCSSSTVSDRSCRLSGMYNN